MHHLLSPKNWRSTPSPEDWLYVVKFRVWLASAGTVFGILAFSFFLFAYNRFINAGTRFLGIVPEGATLWVKATSINYSGNVTGGFCLFLSLGFAICVLFLEETAVVLSLFAATLVILGPPLIAYTYYFSTGSASVTITGVPDNVSAVVSVVIGGRYRESFLLRVPLVFAWCAFAMALFLALTAFWKKPNTAANAPTTHQFSTRAQPDARQTEVLLTTTDMVTQPAPAIV